jgi:hypothetical protein
MSLDEDIRRGLNPDPKVRNEYWRERIKYWQELGIYRKPPKHFRDLVKKDEPHETQEKTIFSQKLKRNCKRWRQSVPREWLPTQRTV